MRIAMVSEHASPLATLGGVDAGGQNVHVAALATALASRGDHVVVHTRRDSRELPRRLPLTDGVLVDHVDAGPPYEIPKDDLLQYMDEFAEDLRWQWRRDRPDVVHAHFWMSGLAAVTAAAPLGIPVVQTFHALGVVKRRHQGSKDTSPPERIGIERRLLADADHVIATCTDEVFELARLGADSRRITVVPCGVDTAVFRPDGEIAPRRADRYRIVSVGRLVERKGVGNVIRALADVPDTELVIAGGPAAGDLDGDPEVRRLRAVAGDAGVGDRVIFLGRVARTALPALLRSADVVASVPWYEPFGIVPLEAMACGVPVVGSAVGGLIDTVVHGRTGLLVEPRRPDAIAAALNELLPDAARREAYGWSGVHRVHQRYRWDRVAAATRQVYDGLLVSTADRISEEAHS